jgi:hypothetical protein
MLGGINRPVFHSGARRILTEVVIAFPILGWPDWSRDKPAATVRTDIVQQVCNASGAERAFIGADARIE